MLVVKFLGIKSYTWIFDCTGVGAPNPYVVPGSTVVLLLCSRKEGGSAEFMWLAPDHTGGN